MLKGADKTDMRTPFKEAQHLLYILTGHEPAICRGKIDKIHEGEHLRFFFTSQTSESHMVRALLKFFNIQHCSDLFKNLEPREGEPKFEFYITVAEGEFKKLQSYFASGASTSLKIDNQKFAMLSLDQPLQKSMLRILFDPIFIQNMKQRNHNEYNLDGIMYYIAKLVLNTIPCFDYLNDRGIKTGFSIELDIEPDSESESDPEHHLALDHQSAITPALHNQSLKRSVSKVVDTNIELPTQKRFQHNT